MLTPNPPTPPSTDLPSPAVPESAEQRRARYGRTVSACLALIPVAVLAYVSMGRRALGVAAEESLQVSGLTIGVGALAAAGASYLTLHPAGDVRLPRSRFVFWTFLAGLAVAWVWAGPQQLHLDLLLAGIVGVVGLGRVVIQDRITRGPSHP